MPSSNPLPTKENNLFKKILKCYEEKQFKNGLKLCKQILSNPKFSEHGETLAMKGLILHGMGRKEESYDLARRGLRNDLRSHVCWHVYGLIQRKDKKYDESIKCYRNALKWDKDNLQILRDLATLQVQMRDLDGYRETRYHIFKLRPTQRTSWIGFAVSYHLLSDLDTTLKILETFQKTITPPEKNTSAAVTPTNTTAANSTNVAIEKLTAEIEQSELYLYQNMILEEKGDHLEAIEHLNKHGRDIMDKITLHECYGSLYMKCGEYKKAVEEYEYLLRFNPENVDYYMKLYDAWKHHHPEESICHLLAICRKRYPRAEMPRRLFLAYTFGEVFRKELREYFEMSLRKGIPPLFKNLQNLYMDDEKRMIIQIELERMVANLRSGNSFQSKCDLPNACPLECEKFSGNPVKESDEKSQNSNCEIDFSNLTLVEDKRTFSGENKLSNHIADGKMQTSKCEDDVSGHVVRDEKQNAVCSIDASNSMENEEKQKSHGENIVSKLEEKLEKRDSCCEFIVSNPTEPSDNRNSNCENVFSNPSEKLENGNSNGDAVVSNHIDDVKNATSISEEKKDNEMCWNDNDELVARDRSDEEAPTTLVWLYFYMGQHYIHLNEPLNALKFADAALRHTPTLIELYILKGLIYKRVGDYPEAVRWLVEAQSMDTADRYINSKCAKYMIRANMIPEADAMCSKFTRDGVSAEINLQEMQCMWFQSECANAYRRMQRWGDALKKCHEIDRYFTEVYDDQFDFHTYCLRKMTLRSYVQLIRMEDTLRANSSFVKGATCAIKIYLRLYDKPLGDSNAQATNGPGELDPKELKKLLSKQRKAKRKAEREKAAEAANEKREQHNRPKVPPPSEEIETNVQEELVPEKLEKVEDPLEKAIYFLKPLQLFATNRLETHLMAFEIYYRKEKPLLMLQAIKRAFRISPESGMTHACLIRFLTSLVRCAPRDALVSQVIDQELRPITRDKPYQQINEDFLFICMDRPERYADYYQALRMKYKFTDDPETKSEIQNDLLYSDIIDSDCKLHARIYKNLLDGEFDLTPAEIEQYREKCNAKFPLTPNFKKTEECEPTCNSAEVVAAQGPLHLKRTHLTTDANEEKIKSDSQIECCKSYNHDDFLTPIKTLITNNMVNNVNHNEKETIET